MGRSRWLPFATTPFSFLLGTFLPIIVKSQDAVYSGCNTDAYYSTLSSSPSRAEIGLLLKSTHRNVLPYTSSSEDTWDALTDLDAGSEAGMVQLIYSDAEAIAYVPGESRSWNREHLWPKSHGVGYSGADFTDIHHLRPADVNVNSSRGNKYFAACGVAAGMDECRSPANPEAGATTATDSEVWLPPENVRGDIARALFYMELRYYGDGSDPNLVLTDCPTVQSDDLLAYRSQLLQWHEDDPVDDAERERNDRACERWQGNRNIFIDFPELVSSIFGAPAQLTGSGGYECSNTGTLVPSPSPPPSSSPIGGNPCSSMQAGDVQIIGVHTDAPDEVALVALTDIPGGLELFLTDDAWTGNSFQESEGTVKLSVPSNGISQGEVFGFGPESSLQYGSSWTSLSGSLSLSTQGDPVFVYCKPTDSSFNFLAAVSTSGPWVTDEFSSHNSALPSSLAGTNTVLSHLDNYQYIGPVEGTKDELVAAIGDESNWEGFDQAKSFSFDSPFTVQSNAVVLCDDLKPGDVQIIGANSDNPDEIALVALENLPEYLELFLTDDAWTGSGFRGSEGTVKLSVPPGGISKGTVFGFGSESDLAYANSWTDVSRNVALSAQGDNVLCYCKPTDSTFNFLAAVSNSGPWVNDDFDSSNSALPPGLKGTNTVLSHRDNYHYAGTTKGTKTEIVGSIGDSVNWVGADTPQPLAFDTFTVQGNTNFQSDDSAATPTFSYHGWCSLFLLAFSSAL
eukprot:scaffold2499_cov125-Cylindrotheca_fusiformis.AAC.24